MWVQEVYGLYYLMKMEIKFTVHKENGFIMLMKPFSGSMNFDWVTGWNLTCECIQEVVKKKWHRL